MEKQRPPLNALRQRSGLEGCQEPRRAALSPARSPSLGRVTLLFLLLSSGTIQFSCGRNPDVIAIGSKNFTESIILGEMLAQQLEDHGFDVERKFNLGGTFIVHQAMVARQLDMYVEYTGTAHSAILELPMESMPDVVRRHADSLYRERWEIVWMEPLGFNNTFAMLVRGETARRLGISTLSEAVPYAGQWQAGFGYEFADRPDGLPGLQERYGLRFMGEAAVMDLALTYRALAEGRVDMIAANSTSGQIEALGLIHLQDDLGFFPPYEAVPVVRSEVLERHPVVGRALRELGGVLSEETMRHLNYLVDAEGREISQVVTEFLKGLGA